MWLLAGLGNPGKKYAGTRHNAGFDALDALIDRYGLQSSGSKFHAQVWKGSIDGHSVLAVKPQTYMNRSGVSVSEAASFYKIPPEQVIVLYDELDLIPGKMRVKQGGGHGGHNGLKDIDRVLGKAYWRVRLGIGHPGYRDQVTGYVLGQYNTQQRELMEMLCESVTRHFPHLLDGAPEKLMSEVARDMPAPPSSESASP